MKNYQKLLDNGWIIHLLREDNKYLAVALSPAVAKAMSNGDSEAAREMFNPKHFAWGKTPELALNSLTDYVLFGRK